MHWKNKSARGEVKIKSRACYTWPAPDMQATLSKG